MKRKILSPVLLLLICAPALAAGPAPKKAAAKPEACPWEDAAQHSIRTGDIEVITPVTGISTAQETYDVFAPFDGRIEELQTELFSFVTPKTILVRMVSTEMAALLDSSAQGSRKQTERRWQDVYSYTEVKPETQGVITNIYVEPKTRVNKGERLFTVAKKVVIIGRNTEPLYSSLSPGMPAKLKHARTDAEFDTVLANFLAVKGPGLINRLWLEVTDLRFGIKIGEQFNGKLVVGKSSNAMLVPRRHIIDAGGRRFLVTEIKTGLETDEETEILGHSSIYLEPPGTGDAKDGKKQKSR